MGQIYSIFNAFHSLQRASLLFAGRAIFGEQKLIKPPQNESSRSAPTTLQSLPVEILIHVFSFLELKPYIISNGVCKEWRRLLPFAELHPIRRRMLELYHRMISTPHFANTRPWTLDNLQSFDRQAYIEVLRIQYPAIPEEFRMWILEWPACLAIGATWPGLPFTEFTIQNCMRRLGVNWLGYKDRTFPQLSAVLYRNKTPDVRVIPALLIWREYSTTHWLIFAEDEPNLFGTVYVTDFLEFESSAVIPHEPDDDDSYDESDEEPERVPYADWISYMEHYWNYFVDDIGIPEVLRDAPAIPDRPISYPARIKFNEANDKTLPTFPWSQRHSVLERAQYS